MKTIHYICTYNNISLGKDLFTFPSAVTKIDYVKGALKEAGFNVKVFSLAEGSKLNNKFIKSDHVKIDKQESQFYINTFGRKNIFFKLVSRLGMIFQLVIYLLTKVKKEEKILVYHSLAIMPVISILRFLKIKSFYFEIEESFAAAYGQSIKKIEHECRYWNKALGYVCVNDILAEKCNLRGKVAICYGDYKTKTRSVKEIPKEMIHVLYAGFIEKEGSDAFIAVESALYLNRNYCVNILGYGEYSNILLLQKRVQEVNLILGYIGVIYHGCLKGKEYLNFLQKCQIGLTTRVLNDTLSDYTFPSKTLVYFCHNLIPVCSPISCIKKSAISDYVIFCEEISSKSVANTILSIDLSKKIDYSELLNSLDKRFILSLKEVFA